MAHAPRGRQLKAKKLCWISITPGESQDFFLQKTIDILAQLDFIEVKKDKQAIRTNYVTHIFFSSSAVKTSRHL
jgi:hypothetical protein